MSAPHPASDYHLSNYFDGNIFVINLARRPDRLAHFSEEMHRIGVTGYERFDGIDLGERFGNHGCTASHRAVLELILARGLKRAFIFEDDATVRPQFRDTFNEELVASLRQIPPDWDMIYLSGHYAEKPRARMSSRVILMGEMKTTTSYGVNARSAAQLLNRIPLGSGDSIDNLYSGYNRTANCYIVQPRLFVQYNNYSDLQRAPMNNAPCMEDTRHENMV